MRHFYMLIAALFLCLIVGCGKQTPATALGSATDEYGNIIIKYGFRPVMPPDSGIMLGDTYYDVDLKEFATGIRDIVGNEDADFIMKRRESSVHLFTQTINTDTRTFVSAGFPRIFNATANFSSAQLYRIEFNDVHKYILAEDDRIKLIVPQIYVKHSYMIGRDFYLIRELLVANNMKIYFTSADGKDLDINLEIKNILPSSVSIEKESNSTTYLSVNYPYCIGYNVGRQSTQHTMVGASAGVSSIWKTADNNELPPLYWEALPPQANQSIILNR